MQRRSVAVLVIAVVAGGSAACTGSASPGPPATPPPVGSVPAPWPPPPDAPVPTDPAVVASTLRRADAELRSALPAWAGGPPTARPPADVVLLSLYEQRVFGTIAERPGVVRQVVAKLPAGLAAAVRANVAANLSLRSLSGPPPATPPKLHTVDPRPAGELLADYRAAERRFHIAWQVLAAVNFIESKFGRVTSSSSAGAQGPMQFIPSTWKAYGLGGNVHDPRDAIMGAANYLSASGAPADYPGAVYHYNPSHAYVRAVLLYARRMMRDPLAYWSYYNWQVFVASKAGDIRLTGPGR
jgi:soluble lytic murein transglycosylase-like protein